MNEAKVNPHQLLTTQEVTELLNMSRSTLYKLRMRGAAPRAITVGGRLRFRRSDLEAWLDAQPVR